MTAAEKNEHYRKLNEQFDERAGVLLGMGYKYERVPALGFAVFTRTRASKVSAVPAALVMNADTVVWADKLEELARG